MFEEWRKDFSEASRQWEYEHIWQPIGRSLKNAGIAMWDGFLNILPDIMGYGAVLTGAIVILRVMGGRSMIKPLGIYGGALIVSMCILAVDQ